MTDERTPEQKAADEAIQAAAELHAQAYRDAESELAGPAIVTEWVISYAARGFTDGGTDVYVNTTHPSQSATPHGAIGLLHTALLDAQANYYGWNGE